MKRIFTLLLIVFLSTVANAQWTLCNKPTGVSPFSLMIHNDTIYMGTVSNGIYRSTDGGTNWTQINSGITSLQIWAINQVGAAVFASSTSGNVYKSINGGDSWVLSNTGISSTAIVRKFVSYNGKIFAATTNTGILISNDNGSSWAQHNVGIVGLVAGEIVVVENDLYAAVNNKRVYKYDPTNQLWIEKSNGLPNQSIGCMTYIKDDLQNVTLFVGNGNYNEVAKSTNGGDNWTIAKNGLPPVGVYSLLGVGTTVYLGNDYGVYQSTDKGLNWVDISGFTLTSPAKFLSKSSTDLYVLQGAALWKKSLSNLSNIDNNDGLINKKIVVFPNPSNGNFNIEVDENLIGSKATVYNLLGQKVKDFDLKATTTNQTLNKGIYLLEIEKDGTKTSKKLIVN
nr:T9SS type A sorting domain-containing protein [uncultured Flavobacterium sp.]